MSLNAQCCNSTTTEVTRLRKASCINDNHDRDDDEVISPGSKKQQLSVVLYFYFQNHLMS